MIGTVVVVLLVTNSLIYWLFHHLIATSEINRLQFKVNNLVESIQGQTHVDSLLRAYLPQNGMIRVINNKKQVLWTVTKESTFSHLPIRYVNRQTSLIKIQSGEKFAIVSQPSIWNNGQIVSIEMTVSLTKAAEDIGMLSMVMIGISLIVLFPVLWMSRILSNLILSPVHTLTRTMEAIQEKREFKKLPLQGSSKDELYLMGKTFNQMIDILQSTFAKQRQFVSDASHELKTPLTVIESYAQLLKRWGSKKPEVLAEGMEAIHSEAIRMKKLTKQMLQLARTDEHVAFQFESVDLISLTKQTIEEMQQVSNREIYLETNLDEMALKIDREKIKQVLVILLDNALKYSEKQIEVVLSQQKQAIQLSIQDEGIGIPQKDLASVFDRFYRVDEARNRETGGSGLGLSIAHQIVTLHHGDISINSEEGKGTKVIVKLPNKMDDERRNQDEK
jgi:signal transduction histidine kinase